ncbi:aminotransferase class V-fold PLP-dependent enzyme [Helicobacter pylori]|uniref:L-seryl-tRNA(Sec) selenium transferase n=1 Tax=Helicobacter pylori HP260AFii TaxID=1159077 RepID=A0ABC9SBY8_HELPX|nr:aminotransferase class V-fold PLP-dependent enzyme [Helicobacter pylori]EMH17824.1 putative L-seryl-tRNA(Sec) selenium transferase [Helicobacter pylori GAM260ASi]EMH26812.1 putative L-seryl-tRNA(Sec) selenium transferase [Helicobacter pylori GAM268Bii]EMH62023.1 putative L-seryl-tRNA(Sec) selenium transferase [Helicobacter pylori HP260AFi]EMH66155.1 putative L-seryl-tRNA(Sec) selenium transferase [Helicobacter pylori HP260ASii]EMH68958.1 putative L-seryl-tRNA(Sec) selenium transferase [Heli
MAKETPPTTPDLLKSPYQKIINASASVFDETHGRSFFSPQFYEKIEPYLKEVLTQPIDLECDLNTAKKTNRLTPLKQLFKACFDTEEILIVNNNTSAVFLIANALAQEKEIVVSYGELVGGDFNLKDILLSSGARLHLVGNTNRAYLRDYRLALNENSKMLFKTHNPTFKKDTPFKDLQALAKEHDLIDYYNLGDVDLLNRTALEEVLALKPSLVSFSADKCFNSAQAGIIMGQKEWVETLKNHPLYRALRVGKITLTLLFHSLKAWVSHKEEKEEIKIHELLNQTKDALLQKALKLYALLKPLELNMSIASSFSKIGNLPNKELESFCVKVQPKNTQNLDCEKLYLKLFQKGVITRISCAFVCFEVFSLNEKDLEKIALVLKEILNKA